MCKLIIHIGYPKTATTSFQKGLFSELHNQGKIEYLNHLNKEVDFLGDIYCRDIVKYCTHGVKGSNYDNELKDIKNISKGISILSNENLSVFNDNFNWANYSNANNNANRIFEVFNEIFDEVHILISIRSQQTLIPSYYYQVYNHIIAERPLYKDARKWINDNFIDKLDEDRLFNFNSCYDKYVSIFGLKYVKVILFEDLKYNQNKVIDIVSNLLDMKKEKIEIIINSMISENVTEKHIDLVKSKTENYTLYSFLFSPIIRLIKNYLPTKLVHYLSNIRILFLVKNALNLRLNKTYKIKIIDKENISKIAERYKNENIILFEKIGRIEVINKYKY